ncbi:TonB-dependent receptor [Sphingopyxis sp. KK2]|uniref:TonB-dependent receptor n=1 Tax=Sphingopyxis sp. KK2 TaxID=1855727 RepID=UPI00097E621C|nr:TonB-dependent receptor [Sphingopyxis sp. KK2]
MQKVYTACSVVAIALAGAMPVHAQDAATSDVVAEDVAASGGVNEIVVTAQKRAESANRVPLSVTAVSGDDLVERGVLSTADLAKVVPGFTYTPTSSQSPVYTIRGIGFYETTLAATPAVTVYTDEVPLPFGAMTKAAGLDLARVEVLKGPQGTLFGQNSTGGAINYVAAKPSDVAEAGISGSFGRFATADLQGYASGPLSDTVGIRIAARGLIGGDWQKSYTRDSKLGEQAQYQGRVILAFTPSDAFRVTLNANGFIDRSDPQAPSVIAITPQRPATAIPALANYPLAPEKPRFADWNEGGPVRNESFWQTALRAEYDIGDSLTLTSLSSFSRYIGHDKFDDGLSIASSDVQVDGRISSFFQELRAAYTAGPVVAIVGGNYSRDKVLEVQTIFVGDSSTNPTFPGVTLPFDNAGNYSDQRVSTYAAFGNLEFAITDQLKLQGGVRYTSSNRSFEGCTYGQLGITQTFMVLQQSLNNAVFGTPTFVPIAPGQCFTLSGIGTSAANSFLPTLVTSRLKEDNVSWRASVSYQATPSAMIYATVSRGYKSGSFPTLSGGFTSQYRAINQENVLAYEAGAKLGLFDRRAQLNFAGFYYDYQDKQLRGKVVDPVFGVLDALTNVPKSRLYGAEVSLDAEPVDGLTINTAATYLNSKLVEYVGIGTTGVASDFAGNRFNFTPKWQLQGNMQYRWSVGGDLMAYVGASALYNGATNSSLGNEPITAIDDYATVDARIGIESEAHNWRIGLWGRNLTNTYYWQNVTRFQDGVSRHTGMPRTYGIEFSKRF